MYRAPLTCGWPTVLPHVSVTWIPPTLQVTAQNFTKVLYGICIHMDFLCVWTCFAFHIVFPPMWSRLSWAWHCKAVRAHCCLLYSKEMEGYRQEVIWPKSQNEAVFRTDSFTRNSLVTSTQLNNIFLRYGRFYSTLPSKFFFCVWFSDWHLLSKCIQEVQIYTFDRIKPPLPSVPYWQEQTTTDREGSGELEPLNSLNSLKQISPPAPSTCSLMPELF